MNVTFTEVLKRFVFLLDERLQREVLTKEDAVRYTFFLALVDTGFCKHREVVLERPHPDFRGEEVDTFIMERDDRLGIMVEFKYDRKPKGDSAQNKTHRAGAVFKDMCRLAVIPDTPLLERYFVYVTDPGMAVYFSNPTNGLTEMFHLLDENLFLFNKAFMDARPATFRKVVENYFCAHSIQCIFRQKLSADHHLRVYSLVRIDDEDLKCP